MRYPEIAPYTAKELEAKRQKPVESGYPPTTHRLFIPPAAWERMVTADAIEIPDGPWHIANHPNRDKPEKGASIEPVVTPDNLMRPERIAQWKARGLLVDTLGRPLHPRAAQLLTTPGVGMYTGPGFNYGYGPAEIGNLMARRVINGVASYAIVQTVRGGKLMWGGPGGYADNDETGFRVALREGREEAGIVFPPEQLARLSVHAELDPPGGFYRATLHAWLEEWSYCVSDPEDPGFEGLELRADGTEARDVRWATVDEIVNELDVMESHLKPILSYERHLLQAGA